MERDIEIVHDIDGKFIVIIPDNRIKGNQYIDCNLWICYNKLKEYFSDKETPSGCIIMTKCVTWLGKE